MSEQNTNPPNPLRRDAAAEGSASHGADAPARTATYPELPDDATWARKAEGLLGDGQDEEDEDLAAHPQDDGDEDGYYEEDYEDAGAGFFDLVWEYKIYLIGFVLVLVVLVGIFTAARGGGEAPSQAPAPETAQKPEPGAARAPEEDRTVDDTGVALQEPVYKEDAGTYYLRAGSIAWKGELEKTDTGEQLTLEGPTAAQFKRSVTLPGGSVMTGVFGRAEPDKPIVHATFHRTTIGDVETTSGTYYAIDNDQVIVEGTYEDTRDGETVTRTYTEHAPGDDRYHSYRVSFEAPLGVPVPVLVGWEPPAEVEQDEAA